MAVNYAALRVLPAGCLVLRGALALLPNAAPSIMSRRFFSQGEKSTLNPGAPLPEAPFKKAGQVSPGASVVKVTLKSVAIAGGGVFLASSGVLAALPDLLTTGVLAAIATYSAQTVVSAKLQVQASSVLPSDGTLADKIMIFVRRETTLFSQEFQKVCAAEHPFRGGGMYALRG